MLLPLCGKRLEFVVVTLCNIYTQQYKQAIIEISPLCVICILCRHNYHSMRITYAINHSLVDNVHPILYPFNYVHVHL